MKHLLFIACLFISLQTLRADDGQKVASKVEKVTVFLNGAQVTRTATASVVPGTTTLVFDNLSPNIDPASMQVRATGDFTILSVKHELNYLSDQLKTKKVEELQLIQKSLRDKISLQTTLLSINKEEANMLTKNQVSNGQTAGLDIVKLKAALDFQTARLTEIKKKELAINNELESLNEQIRKYDSQVNELMQSQSAATSNVLVNVSSKTALQSAFTLTYVVKNAGWYPTYDIRAKNVNSPVSIAYKANVSQQCGEEWKNIKLTLSTGNPTVSGSKPELLPYYLNLGMYYAGQSNSITKVVGRVYDAKINEGLVGVTIRIKGTTIGTTTDMNGNYTLQTPSGTVPVLEYSYIGYESQEQVVTSPVLNVGMAPSSRALQEVVVIGYGSSNGYDSDLRGAASGITRKSKQLNYTATVPIAVNQTENQTNIEFKIDNPYTIPADGKQYLVEIDEVSTEATYQYYVAPKLSTDVFLTARITDWNKYNFLSGEANLFFEGTFIGKSLIDTHIAADTLNLSLGVDKNIVVTRTLQKELNDKQGIFGSNKKESRDWLITVKNRKNQPVNLLVEDQVPVSKNSDIEVDVQDVSGAELDKLTGKTAWSFTFGPQAEKQFHLKYTVKYPKNQSVIVQ